MLGCALDLAPQAAGGLGKSIPEGPESQLSTYPNHIDPSEHDGEVRMDKFPMGVALVCPGSVAGCNPAHSVNFPSCQRSRELQAGPGLLLPCRGVLLECLTARAGLNKRWVAGKASL